MYDDTPRKIAYHSSLDVTRPFRGTELYDLQLKVSITWLKAWHENESERPPEVRKSEVEYQRVGCGV